MLSSGGRKSSRWHRATVIMLVHRKQKAPHASHMPREERSRLRGRTSSCPRPPLSRTVTPGLPPQLTTRRKEPGRSFALPIEMYALHMPPGESLPLCGRLPPADLRRQTLLALSASRIHSSTGGHRPCVHERLSTQPDRTQPMAEYPQHSARRCNGTLRVVLPLPKTQ
eukprot:9469590-Pyramimonas_sp.AAC.2